MADTRLVDPLGRNCVLTDRTWERHILVNHPDMDGGRKAIEQALTTPASIWLSVSDPDVRVYYGEGPRPGLLVVVKVDIKSGIVLTAHLARKITGGSQEWPLSAKLTP